MREATVEEYRTLSRVIYYIKRHGEYWENSNPNEALTARWHLDICEISCRLDYFQEQPRINSYMLITNGWSFNLNNVLDPYRFGSILVHDTDERFNVEVIALKLACTI